METIPNKPLPIATGAPPNAGELLSLVYDQLRHLAAQQLAHEKPGQTLEATALVHEAWLRLNRNQERQWNDT